MTPPTLPCPTPGCDTRIRLAPFLRPGLCDCPCRAVLLRYWREGVAFGGSVPRLRVATSQEEIESDGTQPVAGGAV